ncbi:S-adenosyl-L-methionine-dependent methyltransferase [Trichoderma sp. SZMC 28015]
MSWSTFEELGNKILDQCKILDKFVKKRQELEELKNFKPSFSDYKPWQAFINCLNENGEPEEKDARTRLLDNTADLRDLILGPAGTVVWPALTYPYQLSTLKILNDFSIPQIIPRGETKTVSEITNKLTEDLTTKLGRKFTMSEDFVTRVIRHASTFHILAIDEGTKTVSHTAPSEAFLDNPVPSFWPTTNSSSSYSVQSTLTICLDLRFLNTAFRIGDALLQYGDIVEPNRTAFNLAFGTTDDYLKYMVNIDNVKLCETMLDHLTFVMSSRNMATRDHDQDTLAKYVINKINSPGSEPQNFKIVDMGGGWGHVCVNIAKAIPHANRHDLPQFVVKDLQKMIDNGLDQRPETAEHDQAIIDSISFEKYNFIEDINQSDSADIYMFRFVMHDWSDSRVITILKNIVLNMGKDAHIFIMDYIIPTQHVFPLVVERLKRTMDMAAMSILAGKERTEDDWGQLITRFNKENPDTSLGFRLCPHNEFRTDNEPYTDSEACTDLKPCTNNELCNRKRAFGVVELKLASSSSSDAC